MADRIKFTVIREEWLRGTDGRLFSDGKRCCLGFLGNVCGIPDEALDMRGEPEEVSSENWPSSIVTRGDDETSPHCTKLCQDIIGANDSREGTDEEREEILTRLFLVADIDVEFRDGAGPEARP